MINLQRLNYIKDHNVNDSLSFVADYILQKIQRDKSEFSRYSYDEDWLDLDRFLSKIRRRKSSQEFETIKNMVTDIIDNDDEFIIENSFEKTLIQHLEKSAS